MKINYKQLIEHAKENEYAIGYFEAWDLESLLSIVRAAEKKKSPVIIGYCGGYLDYPDRKYEIDLDLYAFIANKVAENASVPVVTLLNEAESVEYAMKGIEAGFDSVMYVDEQMELEEMIRRQQMIVAAAHKKGVLVEGEVGNLGMMDANSGVLQIGHNTRPEEAIYFVEKTNVDLLAVAFGNVHLLENSKANLDFSLLNKISEVVSLPLVLHGATGISEDDFKKAIEHGIVKINVGAALKRIVIDNIKNYYSSMNVDQMNPNDILGKGNTKELIRYSHEPLVHKVMDYMDIFNSTGKATEFQ